MCSYLNLEDMQDDELPDDPRRDSSVSDSSECSYAILRTGLGRLGWTIRDVVSAVDAGPGTAAAATPAERPSRYSSSEMIFAFFGGKLIIAMILESVIGVIFKAASKSKVVNKV